MKYVVRITKQATQEIEDQYQWLLQHTTIHAYEWYYNIREAIFTLEDMPQRCAIAPEDPYFEDEIRHLLFGKSKGQFRILFTIQANIVRVLHVRHSSMKTLMLRK